MNTVLITGASDGIGREMALAFSRRGFSVGLTARRTELLKAVAADCKAAGAREARWRAVDVADRELQLKALSELDEELGGVRVFVANAGMGGFDDPDEDGGERARRMMAVNVIGAIEGIEFFKMRMQKRGGGRIAGVASIAAARGLPGGGTYSASKAALHAYLQGLAFDLAPRGISVTSICPGFIETAMTEGNRNPMPFLMPAARAGEIFTRHVLRGKFLSIAPWQYIPAFWLLKAIPESLWLPFGALARRIREVALKKEKAVSG